GAGGTGTNYGHSNPLTGVGPGTYYASVTGDCNTVELSTTISNSGPCIATVNVKMFIQGFYQGGGTMTPALLNELVDGATSEDVDSVSVSLVDPTLLAADPNDNYF